ncbi:hypothetical protein [Frankia sp. Cr1]|uniref:hypothetical protein n=1 Tax=Frankia sp. Cr1 TaxID=3073931 RepID=UPI002AD1DF11|nr:hypothetical protein [Frankia sp. Cr1]
MTGYEPTGGDGRYARLYLRDLEPRLEDAVPSMESTTAGMAVALDKTLTAGNPRDAARWIRLIRARTRLPTPWTPGDPHDSAHSDAGRQNDAHTTAGMPELLARVADLEATVARVRTVADKLDEEALECDDSNWLVASGEAAGLRMGSDRIRKALNVGVAAQNPRTSSASSPTP